MAIASNRQTQQPSLTGSSTKCILASRVFIKATASDSVAPAAGRIDDTDPAGWTDLGAVLRSKVTMDYAKEYNEVRSGLDGVYKASYVTAKSCTWSFALDNYDSDVIAALTGSTKDYLVSSGFQAYRLWIGKEDIVEKQVLMVGTNKLDSKEHQYWTPEADLRFAWEEDGDAIVIRVTANLRGMDFSSGAHGVDPTGDNVLSFYQVTIWE